MRDDDPVIAALFDERDTALLRRAFAGYTVDSVNETLGLPGQAVLGRGDLTGVARALTGHGPLQTLIRLFVLGAEVTEADARAAIEPLPLEHACAAGVLAVSAGAATALLDIRPHAAENADWWLVSDFGADVRGGPLPADHVLGIGAASLTLAQATPRAPVSRALDLGTGSGVQALHLGTHAEQVVGTDVSTRALRMAATTAALSGQKWDLRRGSLLAPVAGERFELVVANPPFVVSPGGAGYDYRDSGLRGDGVCESLVRGLPSVLADDGVAQLLANWIIPMDRPWQERLAGWLSGTGCDAWVWQREIAEPAEYVALWLRDAGETPGSPAYTGKYDAWLDWFAAERIAAVGMGIVTLWRTDARDPVVVLEDVPQAHEQPIGAEFPAWHARRRWLASASPDTLLDAVLTPAADLVLDRAELLGADGWQPATLRLRQSHAMRWELEADDAIAALLAGCASGAPLRTPVSLLAAAWDRPLDGLVEAVLPVVRDLIGRGFLVPEGLG
jgi:hypothetical protein